MSTVTESKEKILNYIKSKTDLFRNVSETILIDLENELEWLQLPKGEVLCKQGDPGDSMFILIRGVLGVSIKTTDKREITLNDLKPVSCVGEMSLLTGQPRTAKVYAKANCRVVKLSREGYNQVVAKHPQVISDFLQSIEPRLQMAQLVGIFNNLFGKVETEILHRIHQKLVWHRLSAGEILFRQGDYGDAMYILVNGRLQVAVEGKDGKDNIIDEINPGEFVGEIALLSPEKRSATVYAIRDSNVAKLSFDVFNSFQSELPQALPSITRSMVKRLNTAYGELSEKRSARRERGINIAVIPIHKNVPVADFTKQLKLSLSELNTVSHLNSKQFDQQFDKTGAAQTPKSHPLDILIISWLNKQDLKYRNILYEADNGRSQWTRRCIRQADRILLVGNANTDPQIENLEKLVEQENPRAWIELVLLQSNGQPVNTADWLKGRQIKTHHHVQMNNPCDFKRVARRLTNNAIGLVLGGGGARGYVHLGVIKALEEAGIEVDFVGGTSMGALIAANYACGRSYAEMLETAKMFSSPKKLIDYTFPRTAVTSTKKVTKMLKNLFGDIRIEDLKRSFFCVSSNLSQAEPYIHKDDMLWKAVRASISLPVLYCPVIHNGDVLVDGGIMNNLPIDVMRKQCQDGFVFAVNASAPKDMSGYDFPPNLSGWKILRSKLNPFSEEIRVPTFINILSRCVLVNSIHTLSEMQDQADLLIQPPLSDVDVQDWSAYEEIIELGYQTAKQQIEEWLKMPDVVSERASTKNLRQSLNAEIL